MGSLSSGATKTVSAGDAAKEEVHQQLDNLTGQGNAAVPPGAAAAAAAKEEGGEEPVPCTRAMRSAGATLRGGFQCP